MGLHDDQKQIILYYRLSRHVYNYEKDLTITIGKNVQIDLYSANQNRLKGGLPVEHLKLFIAASKDTPDLPGFFQVKYGGEFAARKFLPHLTNFKYNPHLCTKSCFEFRQRFPLDYTEYLAGIMLFPSVLPELIDDAESYVKEPIPTHDVFVAVGVHPDILIELIKRVSDAGCKAVVVPREDPAWLTTSLVDKLKGLCEEKGLEYAFPRPFCSLSKGKFEYINNFIDQFKIGKPQYRLVTDNKGNVRDVDVKCSSPCGATYHVASGLIGLNKEDIVDTANKLWHTYPCLSSSQMDPDINDSPMHLAAYINLYAARDAQKNSEEGSQC